MELVALGQLAQHRLNAAQARVYHAKFVFQIITQIVEVSLQFAVGRHMPKCSGFAEPSQFLG